MDGNYLCDKKLYTKNDVVLVTGSFATSCMMNGDFSRFNNGKSDIFEEAVAIYKDKHFDYDNFLDKYKFTHLVVDATSYFNDYLLDNEDYEIVFSSYHYSNGKKLLYQNVYALKN